jgi:thioesterase domain-containing protein
MFAELHIAKTPSANGAAKARADEVFVLPATVAQQSLWWLDQLEPGNPAYNIAVRFRLRGPLRLNCLEQALNEIVRRHEPLRTTFAAVNDAPAQIVAPRLAIALKVDDLRGQPQERRDEEAEAIAAAEAHGRFDLARAHLIRARLVQLGEDDHVLLLTVHHIVSDGWSIGVLTHELGVLYGAYCRGLEAPLAALAIQYGDFAVWQEQWLGSSNLDGQIAYWARQLAGLRTLDMPTDRPRPQRQTFAGAIRSVLLPKTLTEGLAHLASENNATLFMVTLAALQVLLRRRAGQDDIVVGSVLAGRPRVELEPLIGLFINSVVLRTDLSGNPPFLELLQRVRRTVLGAFANQDVPFERVVQALQPKRDPSRHPLFQSNFLFQRDFVRTFEAADLMLTAIPSVSPGTLYELNFFMVERAEGWRASCEYNSDLFDSGTVVGLLGQFKAILETIAAHPHRPIDDLALEGPTPPPDAACVGVHTSQAQGNRPPWVVLTGEPNCFADLAALLGPQQPVLSLAVARPDDAWGQLRLEETAAAHIATLRRAVPAGPYLLGGRGWWGVLAYEMARQLDRQGDEVSLVVLFDAACPRRVHRLERPRSSSPGPWAFSKSMAQEFRVAKQLALQGTLAHIRRQLGALLARWREGIQTWFQPRSTPAKQPKQLPRRLPRAARAYQPGPISAAVISVRSAAIQSHGAETSCWRTLCRGGLTELNLPGAGDDLFREPVVGQLAVSLTDLLRPSTTSGGQR